MPFQIIRPTRSNNIVSVRLYDYKFTRILADITTPMLETGLQIVRFQNYGYDVIVYSGLLPMALDFPEGRYMIEIYDGVQWYYSDVFTWISGGMDGYLCVEWSDAANMEVDGGQIVYEGMQFKTGFTYVRSWESRNTSLRKRAKNGTGIFPGKQISEKRFGLSFSPRIPLRRNAINPNE